MGRQTMTPPRKSYWQEIAERQDAQLLDLCKIVNRTTNWACVFLVWAGVATTVALIEAITR